MSALLPKRTLALIARTAAALRIAILRTAGREGCPDCFFRPSYWPSMECAEILGLTRRGNNREPAVGLGRARMAFQPERRHGSIPKSLPAIPYMDGLLARRDSYATVLGFDRPSKLLGRYAPHKALTRGRGPCFRRTGCKASLRYIISKKRKRPRFPGESRAF